MREVNGAGTSSYETPSSLHLVTEDMSHVDGVACPRHTLSPHGWRRDGLGECVGPKDDGCHMSIRCGTEHPRTTPSYVETHNSKTPWVSRPSRGIPSHGLGHRVVLVDRRTKDVHKRNSWWINTSVVRSVDSTDTLFFPLTTRTVKKRNWDVEFELRIWIHLFQGGVV